MADYNPFVSVHNICCRVQLGSEGRKVQAVTNIRKGQLAYETVRIYM